MLHSIEEFTRANWSDILDYPGRVYNFEAPGDSGDVAKKAIHNAMERLQRWLVARERIVRNPRVCGGDPTIKGTRIPAHMIAGHAKASDYCEVLSTYTWICWDDVDAAVMYAKVHPSRNTRTKLPENARIISVTTIERDSSGSVVKIEHSG